MTTREEVVTEAVPFTVTGEWTGHLNQSDREYGFYYEFKLEAGGTGQSYIVSEGSGGSARVRFCCVRLLAGGGDQPELSARSAVVDRQERNALGLCRSTERLKPEVRVLAESLQSKFVG